MKSIYMFCVATCLAWVGLAQGDAVLRSADGNYPGRLLRHTMTNIMVEIHGQVVETHVFHEFKNEWNRTTTAVYSFPLPADAMATGLFYSYNGTIMEAVLREKPQSTVPGTGEGGFVAELNAYLGKNAITLQIPTINPGEIQGVELRYIQRLPYNNGTIRYAYPLYTDKFLLNPLAYLGITMRIHHTAGATSFGSPSHPLGWETTAVLPGYHELHFEDAKIYLQKDFEFTYSMRQTVFATEYHSVKDTVGQGYFALSVYPNTLIQAEDIFNRNVVFLIDISRSMSGYKLEQSCQAITACLSTLNDQDRFALVTFDSYAQIRMAPVAATAANCLAATARLDTMAGLYGASTSNLVSGLTAALQTFSTNVYNNAVMVFTDGFSPCTPQQITNIHNVGIFPVGLGADVSRARLDAIAYANNGYATYFKETDPICNGIIEVFGRISNPVVKGLSFNWAAHGFTDLLPAAAPVALYNGSGFFLTGRYVAGGEYQLILSGSRTSGPLSLAFDLQFSTATDSGKNDFVRRMWAAEKILALERTIEVYGKQDSLRAQVVQLSLAHKIKSSLTSYWCDTLHVSEEHDGDDLLPTAVSVPMPVPANILHEIRISPQPVTSIFTLELPANQKHLAITHVMLVDLAGHVVARIQPVLLTDGKYRLVLYGNDTMHGGIYFLRFCLNGQPQALRIMVAKN